MWSAAALARPRASARAARLAGDAAASFKRAEPCPSSSVILQACQELQRGSSTPSLLSPPLLALPLRHGTALAAAWQSALVRQGPPLLGAGRALLVASRGFYFPRKNWFPWRVRLIHQRQANLRKKRHIWPRYTNPEEGPIFGEKEEEGISFVDKEMRLGMKRIMEFCRLMRGRQLQDAMDWVESIGRLKNQPILKLLRRIRTELIEKYKKDPARVFVYEAHPQFGYYINGIRKHAQGRYGIVKSPRHKLEIKVRELSHEEFFHRLYIRGKVPRSIASDMRLALHEHRVGNQMVKEWAPYLCAHSRLFHRKELKWLDSTRQFDYYQARREWIQQYKANQGRATSEAREARGLPPLSLVG